jgi:LuxR family maltose regulon positive regulatory protein
MYTLYARLLMGLGHFSRADAELREIIAKLEAKEPSAANRRALSGCHMSLALCGYFSSMYTRDYSFADNLAQVNYYLNIPNDKITPPLSVLAMGSYVCRVNSSEKGEMEKFIAALDKMVPCIAMAMGGCAWGLNDLARSELAFFQGGLEEAERYALVSLKKARQQSQYEIENSALFLLLRIALARGDGEAVRDTVKQLEAQLDIPGYINRDVFNDIVDGWFYEQIGQDDKIAFWLKDDFEEIDLNSALYGLETLVKARYHLAKKRFAAVLAILETRYDKYGAASFVMGRIEAKALEAVCRYKLKDIEGAIEALRIAYELAGDNQLFMPFIELGKDMRTLANAIFSKDNTKINRQWLEKVRNGASAYAKKLLIVTRQYHSRNTESNGSTDDGTLLLSPREMGVLTGLSRGLTRAEIAENESISINTVKSVIRSVYNKLEAANQADAVRIAAALGIFK